MGHDARSVPLRTLEFARPHPGVEHAQRFTLRRDGGGGVDVHAALRLVGLRPQACNALAVEAPLGRDLDAQHHPVGTHAKIAANEQ